MAILSANEIQNRNPNVTWFFAFSRGKLNWELGTVFISFGPGAPFAEFYFFVILLGKCSYGFVNCLTPRSSKKG